MKTLLFLFILGTFLPHAHAESDKLEEKIKVIQQAVDDTLVSIRFADSKAANCTGNYVENVTCPKTGAMFKTKGIKQEFTVPIWETFKTNKVLVESDLLPLPSIVKKPVDEAGLKKVDACSEGELIVQKDFQSRLDALKKGKASLIKITDGSGGLGTKGWYSKLFNQNKKEAEKFQQMSKACITEAGYGLLASMAPDDPYGLFRGAFERDANHKKCDPKAVVEYDKIAHKENGTIRKINDAAAEIHSALNANIKKLEKQIADSVKRREGCKSGDEAKNSEEKKEAEKKADEKKENEGKKPEEKPDTSKVDEKKSTISGDTDNCDTDPYGPYGGDVTKNSCYKAAGTAKERSSRLATLIKKDPVAVEKALIDRDTPEAKALSKDLLDKADAYAKANNLPSPKVSAKDTVCGESCVAYLKAKSAEESGVDAARVNYLKKKASTTQRRKLQDISY